VFLGQDKETGKFVAVKRMYFFDAEKKREIETEIEIMESIEEGNNVMTLLKSKESEDDEAYFLVMKLG
jgi:hypothetical protein